MSTIQTVIRSEPFFVRGEAFTGTEGNYILQHHQQEIERLQKQHNFILSSTGGVLVTAPLNGNNTLRVLDSGAADGTWLRSLAQLYPFKSWSLHGVDIASTPFPPRSAEGPRLDLRRFDIRLPAPGTLQWTSSFDLINQRLLTWDLKPQEWPRVIGNLSRLLRPGGWIQLVECQWVDNNAPFDHAKTPQLFKMSQLQKWITATCGININVSYELEKLLKNAGLVNIQTTRFELGYGSKAREARWKQPSADMLIETLRSMRYKMPPEGIPGVANTPAEFDKFLDDLTDEIMEHGYAPVLSYVVGQKTPRVPIRYQL